MSAHPHAELLRAIADGESTENFLIRASDWGDLHHWVTATGWISGVVTEPSRFTVKRKPRTIMIGSTEVQAGITEAPKQGEVMTDIVEVLRDYAQAEDISSLERENLRAAADEIERLRAEVGADGWRRATEASPAEGELVICCYVGVYGPRIVTYSRGHYGCADEPDGKGSQPATHWMPLPTVPKPGEPT